jgi:hypothetical protein
MAQAATAYRGIERRHSARAADRESGFAGRHYYGALRRASDLKLGGGGLAGFA